MIKFFRNIRQNMIKQNRFSNYLLYAIGEIVLVMIGILLALQVNNWNQDRQQRQKEKKILIELKRDLVSNDTILQHEIKMQQTISEEIRKAIAHLKNKKPFNDTINMYLAHAYYVERIQFNSSAYESLKSVGIDIISSDALRADISNLFGNALPDFSMWITNIGLEQANFFHPFFVKYFENTGEFNPVKSSLGFPDPLFIPDYDNLLKSQEFINALALRSGTKGAMGHALKNLQVSVKKTINEIDKDLETF